MPYLNFDLDYFSHRKVVRLCARLGAWAESLPLKIWVYTGKYHAKDGFLIGYQPLELLALAGVQIPETSNASSILAALLDVEVLHAVDGGWAVHEWLEHQGHIAAFAVRGRNNANKRWAKIHEKGRKDATSTAKGNAPTLPSYPTYLPTESSAPTNPSLAPLPGATGEPAAPSADANNGSPSSSGARQKKPRATFTKPTFQEVEEYISIKKYVTNPKTWYAHYESNGWKVGKNQMVSWKAAIVSWESRQDEKHAQSFKNETMVPQL